MISIRSKTDTFARCLRTAPLLLTLALAACSGDDGTSGDGADDDAGDDGGGAAGTSGEPSSGSGNQPNSGAGGTGNQSSTGDVGGTGNAGGSTDVGPGGGAACDGTINAGDNVETAWNLAPVGDCDSDQGSAEGVLTDAGDEDWYMFVGDDTSGCVVDPTLTVEPSVLGVCAYFLCNEGPTSVWCPDGSTESTNEYGDPGCCGSGTLSPTVACEEASFSVGDEAAVYIKLRGDNISCMPYTLSYHY